MRGFRWVVARVVVILIIRRGRGSNQSMIMLLTCIGMRWFRDLVLVFLNEHSNSSRIPLRKFRLRKAYSSGLTPELKYVTRKVSGVNKALKFESPW